MKSIYIKPVKISYRISELGLITITWSYLHSDETSRPINGGSTNLIRVSCVYFMFRYNTNNKNINEI